MITSPHCVSSFFFYHQLSLFHFKSGPFLPAYRLTSKSQPEIVIFLLKSPRLNQKIVPDAVCSLCMLRKHLKKNKKPLAGLKNVSLPHNPILLKISGGQMLFFNCSSRRVYSQSARISEFFLQPRGANRSRLAPLY